MKVRLAPRALSEAERLKTWWLKNRPLAPELFDQEIATAIERIVAAPRLGAIYPSSFGRTVRRVLMQRTQNHIYCVVRKNEVVVLSVWGAPRANGRVAGATLRDEGSPDWSFAFEWRLLRSHGGAHALLRSRKRALPVRLLGGRQVDDAQPAEDA